MPRAPGETRPAPPKKKSYTAGYTYTSPQGSVLYTDVLSPYLYEPITSLYPRWLHPNAITFAGFVAVVAGFALVAAHSPTLGGHAEPWVYLVAAALFELYVIFDNTDGKQARRTGLSSAAGETFDHGVDMSVATLGMLLVADATAMAPAMLPMQLLAAHITTFVNNWHHKITGQMSWGGRYLSVDEATAVTVFTLLFAGVFGPQVYTRTELAGPGWNPFRPKVPASAAATGLIEWDAANWGAITLGDGMAIFSWCYSAIDTVQKLAATLTATDPTEGSGRTMKDALTSLAPLGVHVWLCLRIFYGCTPVGAVGAGLLAGVLFSAIGLRVVLSMKFHPESDEYVLHTAVMVAAWAAAYAATSFGNCADPRARFADDRFAWQVVAMLSAGHALAFANGLQVVNDGKPLFSAAAAKRA